MNKHIHQKEIIAWANGSEIEMTHHLLLAWVECEHPEWQKHIQYRVKPELSVLELAVQALEALEKDEWEEEVERRVQKRFAQIKFQEEVEKGIDMLMHND